MLNDARASKKCRIAHSPGGWGKARVAGAESRWNRDEAPVFRAPNQPWRRPDSIGRYALTKIALQKSRPSPGGTGRMVSVDVGGDEIRGLARPPDRRDPQRSLMWGLAGRYAAGAGTAGQLTDAGDVLS